MLNDERLEVIHDFPETSDCFPGINIRGGVCYFLWNKFHKGDCKVVNHKQNEATEMVRPLLEKGAETFIRYNAAVSILEKVSAFNEETMDNRVSSRLPFGIPSNFTDYTTKPDREHSITLYRSERSKNADKRVFVSPWCITKNKEWKDHLKVLVSKASPGGDEYPHSIISAPIFAERNSVCTETYLIVDFVNSEEEGNNLISYMRTKFFRFMMSLIKNTQNISKGVFAFVPVQDWSKPWTDEELYAKYGIVESEIAFIDSMIRPMEGEE
jgi:site-specific DNA-methyltransferase (adenine-specific)